MDGASDNLRKYMKKTAERVLLQGKNLSLDKNPKENEQKNPGAKVQNKIQHVRKHRNSRDKMNKLLKRPVGYLWNKGGRLKELRIRTLARKYLHIWRRKTFGNKTFTEVDKYYETKIAKKFFTVWKNDWWKTGKEWKLIVRADYHYKYAAYAKVWRCWMEYHKQQKLKNVQMNKAHEFWKINISYKVIIQWKIYTNMAAEKHVKNKIAKEFHDKKLSKSSFNEWVEKYRLSKENKRNNEIALWHWMDTMQRNVWNLWRLSYYKRQEENVLVLKANEHCKRMNLKRTWDAWVRYVLMRRKKNDVKDFASTIHRRSLVRSSICIWHDRLIRKRNIQMLESQIEALSKRFQSRKYLEAWKRYHEDCKCFDDKMRRAMEHYRRTVLAKGICALKAKADERKQAIEMKYIANEHYILQTQRRAFNIWLDKLDDMNDEKLASKYAIAKSYFNAKLLKHGFAQWKEWIAKEKEKVDNMMKADSHYITKVLPKYFQIWMNYQHNRKVKEQANETAVQFYRESCMYKYLNLMVQKCENAQEYRTMDRMAILHHNESLLTSCFQSWKRKTKNKLKENQRTAIACENYRHLIISKYFAAWKSYIEAKRNKRQNVVKAAIFVYHKNTRTVLEAWKRYVLQCKHKKTKLRITLAYRENSLLKRSFVQWKGKYEKIKHGKMLVETQINKKKSTLQFKTFSAWKIFVQKSKEKQDKRNQAIAMNDHNLKMKFFERWVLWNEMETRKSEELDVKLIEYKHCKNNETLKNTFNKWKLEARTSKEYHLNHERAVTHYNTKLCEMAIKSWTLYRLIQTKKIILNERAAVFNANLIKVHTLKQWKRNYELKNEENMLTAKALWFWALNLEYRVLQGWVEYAKVRKQKKTRYSNALLLRRHRMIRKGCSNLLKFQADQIQFKTKAAAWKQAKTSYNAYHLAWKYAKRWRSKVGKRTTNSVEITCSKTQLEMSVQDIEAFKADQPLSRNICNWVPEPRVDPFDLSPSSSKSKRLKAGSVHRPSPRRPEFLLESLQRMDNESVCEKSVHFSEPIATSKVIPPSLEANNTSLKMPTQRETAKTVTAIMERNNKPKNVKNKTCSKKETESNHLTLMPPSAFMQTVEQDFTSKKRDLASGDGMDVVNQTQFSDLSVCSSLDPIAIQNELLYITKKIQSFKKLKDNLSDLRNQKLELEKIMTSCDLDEGIQGIKNEIVEIDSEIQETSHNISSQRPIIETLANRVKYLIQLR